MWLLSVYVFRDKFSTVVSRGRQKHNSSISTWVGGVQNKWEELKSEQKMAQMIDLKMALESVLSSDWNATNEHKVQSEL